MTRPINPTTLAALEADAAAPVYFVELQVVPGSPDRFHTWLGTISWGGNNWTGVGDIYSLDSMTETTRLRPEALRMGLSGLSSRITQIAYESNWYQRPCIVYLGAIVDGQLVADPDIWFSGVLQDMTGSIGSPDGDVIQLKAESELIFFKRSRNVRYTNNQLQSEFAGDLGLEFLESVATQKVIWGGQEASGGAGGRGLRDIGEKLR